MAKVISWSIEDKLAYLGGKINGVMVGPQIRPASEPLTGTELSDLASYWVSNNDENAYASAFSEMLALVGPTNLKGWRFYYNVLNDDDQYSGATIMIAGKDGKNTYDTGTPYYTLHILNQNIAIGLGGDYILDVDRNVTVDLYVERDGVNKTANITKIEYKDTASSGSYTAPSYDERMVGNQRVKRFEVLLPNGSDFTNTTHIKSFEIKVSIGDYISTTYFTVTGLKNGEEGSFYNLTISPKTIKRVREGDTISYSSPLVNAYCVKNGTVITADNIKIMYNNGKMQSDAPFPTGGIAAEDVYNAKDNTILVKLLYNNNVIDTDSCTVLEDGADASPLTKLELDNEMDGISFGESNVLLNDIFTGSGVKMWYEGSELPIKAIKFKIVASPDEINFMACRTGSDTFVPFSEDGEYIKTFNDGSYPTNVSFDLQFKEGFTINDNYREVIKISATASTNNLTASTNYVLIGIKGGKNGEIYRIQTDYDYVIYDPNTNVPSTTTVSCVAYAGNKDITEDPQYALGCSYDVVYNTWEEILEAVSRHGTDAKYIDETNYFSAITNGNSSVTFYLFYKSDNENRYLLDRETVPIIYQGMDAHERVMLELDNEVTGIALGGDGKLDTQTDVGTTFTLYSGASPCQYSKIMVEAPSELNGYTCKLRYGSSTSPKTKQFAGGKATFDEVPGNNGTGEIIVTLTSPTYFNTNNQKKLITITAYDENGTGYHSVYSILGINNGEDGIVYRLVPQVNSVVYNQNEEKFTPEKVKCTAYQGVSAITIYDEEFRIKYIKNTTELNPSFEAAQDVPSDGVPLENNDIRITFYLFYQYETNKWTLVDRESVPVVTDGKNASDRAYLELGNEIDAFGVGSNLILESAVTVGTEFFLYSGTNKLVFTEIVVKTNDGSLVTKNLLSECSLSVNGNTEKVQFNLNNNAEAVAHFDGTNVPSNNGEGKIEFTLNPNNLPDGITFYGDQKRIFKITATAEDGETYSANFTLLGLMNGNDGEVFRLMPDEDIITLRQDGTSSPVKMKCAAYLGTEPLTIAKTPAADTYVIYYSIGTSPIDEPNLILQDWVDTSEVIAAFASDTSTRLYFYLYYHKTATSKIFYDRESIPVIRDGKDGSAAYLELTNEIDGVALGGDGDIDKDVLVGSPMFLYSGSTSLKIDTIKIECNSINTSGTCQITYYDELGNTAQTSAKEFEFSSFDSVYKVYFDRNDFGGTFCHVGSEGTIVDIVLPNGLVFENSQKKFKITVSSNAATYSAFYKVIGIPGGVDGEVYRLMPDSNTILYDPNADDGMGAVYPDEITCEAKVGINKVTSGDTDLIVSYSANGIAYNDDEFEHTISGTTNEIVTVDNLRDIMEDSHGRIYFYLWYKYDEDGVRHYFLVDRESIPYISDGKNGEDGKSDVRIYAELGNEIEAIGLGGDSVLAHETPVSSAVYLYSGATGVPFTHLLVTSIEQSEGFFNNMVVSAFTLEGVHIGCGTITNNSCCIDIRNGSYGRSGITFTMKIPEETVFPSPTYKHRFKIGLQSGDTNQDGIDISDYTWETEYTVLGIKEGTDGVVYRLVPERDAIVYDPNGAGQFDKDTITCSAYAGGEEIPAKDHPVEVEEAVEDGEEESAFYIYYSINGVYKGDRPDIDTNAVTALTDSVDLASYQIKIERVYFYLYYKTENKSKDTTYLLFDRESVPVVKNGLNVIDSRVFLELGNEMSPVSIGPDTELNIPEDARVPIDISFSLISAATEIGFTGVSVESSGDFVRIDVDLLDKDDIISGGTFERESDGSSKKIVNFDSVVLDKDSDPKIRIYLVNGFNFGVEKRTQVKITVKAKVEDAEDGYSIKDFSATHTIFGVSMGKEGLVYNLIPNTDSIVKSQNGDSQAYQYLPLTVSCDAATKDGTLSGDVKFFITYNIDDTITKSSYGTLYHRSGTNVDRWNSGLTLTSLPSISEKHHIYFALWYYEDATNFVTGLTDTIINKSQIIDKESIPIIENGKDGKSASERAYLSLSNEIEAVGTGGDENPYTLDHTARTETDVIFYSGGTKTQFNGNIIIETEDSALENCVCKLYTSNETPIGPIAGHEIEEVTENSKTVYRATFASNEDHFNENDGSVNLKIELKSGINFDPKNPKKYVTIKADYTDASLGGTTYPVTFIIYALKEGMDGYVYRLTPQYNSLVYDGNTTLFDVSTINCPAIANGEVLTLSNTEGTKNTYETRYSFNDTKLPTGRDKSTFLQGDGFIELNSLDANIRASLNRIYFYLYYVDNDRVYKIMDRETVPVLLNGLNAKSDRVYIDLDNEMDGVSTGSDNILQNSVTLGTGVHLYSGASPTSIEKLAINGPSEDVEYSASYKYNGSTYTVPAKKETEGSVTYYVFDTGITIGNQGSIKNNDGNIDIIISLNSGFTFDESTFRQGFSIIAWKTPEDSSIQNPQPIAYSAVYAIIGFKSGRDGEDGVVYRLFPSENAIVYDPNTDEHNPTEISCDSNLETGDSVYIKYSINKDVGIESAITYEGPIACSFISDRIYFYLVYDDDELGEQLLDRESVPVLLQGLNSPDVVYLELGNEIDGVGLDGDTTIESSITLNTDIFIVSGETKESFKNYTLTIDGDGEFEGCSCEIVNHTTTPETKTGKNFNHDGTVTFVLNDNWDCEIIDVYITLKDGFNFGNVLKKTLKFTATSPDGTHHYNAYYKLLGLKSGKDGDVYKLFPTVNDIFYDPNTEEYAPDVINCRATVNYTEDVTSAPDIYLRYTVDNLSEDFNETLPFDTESGITLSEISAVTFDRIYFYMFAYVADPDDPDNEEKGDYYLLDRESIPVMSKPINNSTLQINPPSISINCDEDGNILTDAVYPKSQAVLMNGNEAVAGAEYSRATKEQVNVEIDSGSGLITIRNGQYEPSSLIVSANMPSQEKLPETFIIAYSLNEKFSDYNDVSGNVLSNGYEFFPLEHEKELPNDEKLETIYFYLFNEETEIVEEEEITTTYELIDIETVPVYGNVNYPAPVVPECTYGPIYGDSERFLILDSNSITIGTDGTSVGIITNDVDIPIKLQLCGNKCRLPIGRIVVDIDLSMTLFEGSYCELNYGDYYEKLYFDSNQTVSFYGLSNNNGYAELNVHLSEGTGFYEDEDQPRPRDFVEMKIECYYSNNNIDSEYETFTIYKSPRNDDEGSIYNLVFTNQDYETIDVINVLSKDENNLEILDVQEINAFLYKDGSSIPMGGGRDYHFYYTAHTIDNQYYHDIVSIDLSEYNGLRYIEAKVIDDDDNEILNKTIRVVTPLMQYADDVHLELSNDIQVFSKPFSNNNNATDIWISAVNYLGESIEINKINVNNINIINAKFDPSGKYFINDNIQQSFGQNAEKDFPINKIKYLLKSNGTSSQDEYLSIKVYTKDIFEIEHEHIVFHRIKELNDPYISYKGIIQFMNGLNASTIQSYPNKCGIIFDEGGRCYVNFNGKKDSLTANGTLVISKNMAGQSSISYWLSPSETSIVVTKDTEKTYNITCDAFKQRGTNEPELIDGTLPDDPTIWYKFDIVNTALTEYDSPLEFSREDLKVETQLTFFLISPDGAVYDTKSINILLDKSVILRRSVWEADKQYYDGNTEEEVDGVGTGNYYLDVTTNKGVATIGEVETGIAIYKVCISSHKSDEYPNNFDNYELWTKVKEEEPLATPLLIASAISSDYLDVNTLKVYDNLQAQNVILFAGNRDVPLICGSNIEDAENITLDTIENNHGVITSWITANGDIHSKNLIANGGKIGGFQISENILSSDGNKLILDPNNNRIVFSNGNGADLISIESNEYDVNTFTGNTSQIGTFGVGDLDVATIQAPASYMSSFNNAKLVGPINILGAVTEDSDVLTIKNVRLNYSISVPENSAIPDENEPHPEWKANYTGNMNIIVYYSGITTNGNTPVGPIIITERNYSWTSMEQYMRIIRRNNDKLTIINDDLQLKNVSAGNYGIYAVLTISIYTSTNCESNYYYNGIGVTQEFFTGKNAYKNVSHKLCRYYGNGLVIAQDVNNLFCIGVENVKSEQSGFDGYVSRLYFKAVGTTGDSTNYFCGVDVSTVKDGTRATRTIFKIAVDGQWKKLHSGKNVGVDVDDIRIGNSLKLISGNENIAPLDACSYRYFIVENKTATANITVSTYTLGEGHYFYILRGQIGPNDDKICVIEIRDNGKKVYTNGNYEAFDIDTSDETGGIYRLNLNDDDRGKLLKITFIHGAYYVEYFGTLY